MSIFFEHIKRKDLITSSLTLGVTTMFISFNVTPPRTSHLGLTMRLITRSLHCLACKLGKGFHNHYNALISLWWERLHYCNDGIWIYMRCIKSISNFMSCYKVVVKQTFCYMDYCQTNWLNIILAYKKGDTCIQRLKLTLHSAWVCHFLFDL